MATLRDGKNVFSHDCGARFTRIDGALLPKVQPDFLYSSERAYRGWSEAMLPTSIPTMVKMVSISMIQCDQGGRRSSDIIAPKGTEQLI